MHLPGIRRRRLSARFDLSAISVVEGVRAGLAAAVPIGIGFWLNRPDYSLAALGALLTCICDPVGPMGRRLRLLVAFVALGGLLLGGFGFCARRALGPPSWPRHPPCSSAPICASGVRPGRRSATCSRWCCCSAPTSRSAWRTLRYVADAVLGRRALGAASDHRDLAHPSLWPGAPRRSRRLGRPRRAGAHVAIARRRRRGARGLGARGAHRPRQCTRLHRGGRTVLMDTLARARSRGRNRGAKPAATGGRRPRVLRHDRPGRHAGTG